MYFKLEEQVIHLNNVYASEPMDRYHFLNLFCIASLGNAPFQHAANFCYFTCIMISLHERYYSLMAGASPAV